MKKNTSESTYNITNDTSLLNDIYGITPQINSHIQKAYKMALSGNASQVKKLQDFIEKYPQIPHFKNFLSVLYQKRDQEDKAYETIKRTIQENPDYLFGKLNYADMLIDEGELERIPEILGEEMELYALYPERDTFHISEVTSFYQLKARYCMMNKDLDGIEECGEFLDEVAPDSNAANMVTRMLAMETMRQGMVRMEREQEDRIVAEFESEAANSNKVEEPEFTHSEIFALYQNDMHIDREILHNILTLPRTSVIKDLEQVLVDSIERFNHFHSLLKEDDGNVDFMIHAILLLGELEAVESLPVVLRMLSQHEEYFDMYFSDYLNDGLWEPVYKIANSKLDELKAFMLEPNKHTYAKSMLFKITEQIVAHQPERKQEVVNWYQDLCTEYAKCSVGDNIIDNEMFAFLIWSYADIVGKDAGPYIKPLFTKGWVAEGICGSYNDIISESKKDRISKDEILDIDKRYDDLLNKWFDFMNEKEYETPFNSSIWDNVNQPVLNESKVGRNDPCPCGSGKKYKKCCLEN
ncbi:DUF1186 domain-containing protein [Plebeiibacterium marinum]|uniref:DUF1186 domain-containing protein n=1 Tax=Plebeiibacterium marinum TaxID=2992111 RepID=UPI00263B5E34|nr:DUF1186 domain-containing protein [Plebeiobacterium marinum]